MHNRTRPIKGRLCRSHRHREQSPTRVCRTSIGRISHWREGKLVTDSATLRHLYLSDICALAIVPA